MSEPEQAPDGAWKTPPRIIESHSVEETQNWGRVLARVLQPGSVVGLVGELGAGKTHLVQAIADAMQVRGDLVNSPTFVLIQEYSGTIDLCHIDAYRLADADEFLELGADELLGADNICLIEWADRIANVLPADRLTVAIELTGESTRRMTCSAGGPVSERMLRKLPVN